MAAGGNLLIQSGHVETLICFHCSATNILCSLQQYSQYSTIGGPAVPLTPKASAPSSQAPEAPIDFNNIQQDQVPIHDSEEFFQDGAGISGAPIPPGKRLLKREERIEYRDQDGNVLDEEKVKALEGKVEFRTRYETRTRVIDAEGNVLPDNIVVAPPNPDVEGLDTQTAKKEQGDELVPDAKESIEGDQEAKAKAAKPASEKVEGSSQA